MDKKLTQSKLSFFGFLLLIILIIFSFYNSLIIGLAWDENSHHINGQLRWEYLKTFGEFKDYDYWSINPYNPGLYDTLHFVLSKLLANIFSNKYIVEIKHSINFIFSFLSIVGFFLLTKKIFSKDIAIIASILCLLNPFFFGHMGINPKDVIIFFSFVWFSYFFLKYLKGFEKKRIKNLIIFSFFIGFGCGTRISFLLVIFPVLVLGLLILTKKFSNNINILIKNLLADFVISLFIVTFLIILCWPQLIDNGFSFFLDAIKNSVGWIYGPRLSLINGNFYETANTPPTYFLSFLIFKMPIYVTMLILLTLFLILKKNIIFFNKDNYFKFKFLFLIILILFPIIISIIFRVKIYDNIRLFLFLLPLVSLVASFSLFYLLKTFKEYFYSKVFLFIIFLLLLPFSYRFLSITPYQYSYINFSYPYLEKSINKFEHDYWGTSFKELTNKMENKIGQKVLANMKITICGGDRVSHIYYFKKHIKNKLFSKNEADYVLMTNRASFDVNNKTTCFNEFKGEDLVTVSRLGLTLSTFRKLSKN